MSLKVTRRISVRSTAIPIVWASASYFGLIFFPNIPSIRIKKNLPPSSAGIGKILKNAKDIDKIPARFNS